MLPLFRDIQQLQPLRIGRMAGAGILEPDRIHREERLHRQVHGPQAAARAPST